METAAFVHHGTKSGAMSQLKSVNIPKPCQEAWQAMTPVNGGRHCQSCSKTVTDFTKMSNDEIITYLSTHSNVCGKIQVEQLNAINQRNLKPLKQASYWLNYRVAALFAGIMAFTKAEAQTKVPEAAKVEQHAKHLLGDTVISDTTKPVKITGIIRANADGTSIPGAIVRIPGTNYGVQTDSGGHFTIWAKPQTQSIQITAIGYQQKTIKLTKLPKKKYKIYLDEAPGLIGEVMVVE